MVEPPITYLAFPLPTFLISTISFSIMVNLSCSFLIPEYHGQPANTLANDFWTLNIIYARPNDIADRFLNITITATGEMDFNRTRRDDFDNANSLLAPSFAVIHANRGTRPGRLKANQVAIRQFLLDIAT